MRSELHSPEDWLLHFDGDCGRYIRFAQVDQAPAGWVIPVNRNQSGRFLWVHRNGEPAEWKREPAAESLNKGFFSGPCGEEGTEPLISR